MNTLPQTLNRNTIAVDTKEKPHRAILDGVWIGQQFDAPTAHLEKFYRAFKFFGG